MEKRIARWESRGGKYWVDLYYDPAFELANGKTIISAHYAAPNAGGSLISASEEEVISAMQSYVDIGYFQPDAAKTPMKRVSIS